MLKRSWRWIVCFSHTFENYLWMKRKFTKYLKESCCWASDQHFSLKCFQENAFEIEYTVFLYVFQLGRRSEAILRRRRHEQMSIGRPTPCFVWPWRGDLSCVCDPLDIHSTKVRQSKPGLIDIISRDQDSNIQKSSFEPFPAETESSGSVIVLKITHCEMNDTSHLNIFKYIVFC